MRNGDLSRSWLAGGLKMMQGEESASEKEAEHVIDLKHEIFLSATVHRETGSDAGTIMENVVNAQRNVISPSSIQVDQSRSNTALFSLTVRNIPIYLSYDKTTCNTI